MAGVSRRGSVRLSVAEPSLGSSGGSMSERKREAPSKGVFNLILSHTWGHQPSWSAGTEGMPRMWDLVSKQVPSQENQDGSVTLYMRQPVWLE